MFQSLFINIYIYIYTLMLNIKKAFLPRPFWNQFQRNNYLLSMSTHMYSSWVCVVNVCTETENETNKMGFPMQRFHFNKQTKCALYVPNSNWKAESIYVAHTVFGIKYNVYYIVQQIKFWQQLCLDYSKNELYKLY